MVSGGLYSIIYFSNSLSSIDVTVGWFEGIGPQACPSPFTVMLWIRSDYLFRSEGRYMSYSEFLQCKHLQAGFKPGNFGTNCVWTLLTPKPNQPARLDVWCCVYHNTNFWKYRGVLRATNICLKYYMLLFEAIGLYVTIYLVYRTIYLVYGTI